MPDPRHPCCHGCGDGARRGRGRNVGTPGQNGFMTSRSAGAAHPTEGEQALLGGLVGSLIQTRTAIAALQALETQMLAAAVALADEQSARGPADTAVADIPLRSIAAEVAAALRLSDRSVQRQLSDAATIVQRFPATLDALATGRISRAHLSVIVEAGVAIEGAEARAAYERLVIERAAVETPGRLRPIARHLAEHVQPRSIDERHAAARMQRRVTVTDLDDGMAELLAILPATLARGIHDRLTQAARAVMTDAAASEDPRSIDEIRADLLCDLTLTGLPAVHGGGLDAIAGSVQITVPVLSLLGHEAGAAFLVGHGPIDLDTAKRLTAGAAGWDRVLTHPITGAVLSVDRYRPTEKLRRLLRARDETCRFPGCRMSALRADLDHTHDAALGGATEFENLAHLCRRHHVLKHASPWTVRQLGDGLLEWTSPTGRTYVDRPAPTLRFVPDGDPPPF